MERTRLELLFDQELLQNAVSALQLFSLTYLTRWFSFATQSYMLAIEKPLSASLISVSTALVFPVVLIGALWPLGLTGIWLNFAGTSLLAGLLSLIILRCIWVARNANSPFHAYVAMGMAGMLLIQVAANVGMCLFVFPVMGLTLPFFSYGGSSIITLYAAMGIVSSIKARNLPSWLRDRSGQ